jgi:predicted nucleic acid-binding protein
LSTAADAGSLLICPVVYAELAGNVSAPVDLERLLAGLKVELDQFSPDALWQAGRAWRTYAQRRGQEVECVRCGRRSSVPCSACGAVVAWRQHLITDFLIGAHAQAQADALLTRDTGYYRTYFPQLRLVVPGAAPLSSGAAT